MEVQMRRMRSRAALPLLFLVIVVLSVVRAQESASIQIPIYTHNSNESKRQNICDRVRQYEETPDLELRYALEGFQMNVAAAQSTYFLYPNNTLAPDYPGLAAVLLDELADRGRFTWRDSFAVYDGPGDGRTWDELLLWTTNMFDLSADWWIENLSRLKLGIAFPEAWYDSSYILVTALGGDAQSEQHINMWGWILPFTGGVWIMIILTLLYSGCVYMFLEFLAFPSQYTSKRARESFGNDIFLSFLLFTQHFQFNPKTPASRLLATSMALWALLISSAYTANLASFFVTESNYRAEVETIEDAIRLGKSLCVVDTTAHGRYVQATYPKATLVRVEHEKDLYLGVSSGACNLAVATMSGFLEFEKEKETNANCQLRWVGNIIKHSTAGFATKADAGRMCTSLIHDVLNLHMLEMKADGFVDNAWNIHLARNQDHFCDSSTQAGQNSGRRSLYEMGGTFVFHFAVSGVAIVLAVGTKMWKVCKKRQVLKMTLSKLQRETGDIPTDPPEGDVKVSGTTFRDDFWRGDTSLKYRYASRASVRRPTMLPKGGSGLNNVQLLELLQDEFLQQQEQLQEEFRRQQEQLERKMQDQIGTIMDALKQTQTTTTHDRPRRKRSQKNVKSSARSEPSESSIGTYPSSLTEGEETQSHPKSRKAGLQIPHVLYPHEEQELRGAIAEYFDFDFPTEAKDSMV